MGRAPAAGSQPGGTNKYLVPPAVLRPQHFSPAHRTPAPPTGPTPRLRTHAPSSDPAHERPDPQAAPLPPPRARAARAARAQRVPRPAHAQAPPRGQWATPPLIRCLSAVRRPARVSLSGSWADAAASAGTRARASAPARLLAAPSAHPVPAPARRPQRPPSGAMSQSGTPGLQEESLQGEPRGGGRGPGTAAGAEAAPVGRGASLRAAGARPLAVRGGARGCGPRPRVRASAPGGGGPGGRGRPGRALGGAPGRGGLGRRRPVPLSDPSDSPEPPSSGRLKRRLQAPS